MRTRNSAFEKKIFPQTHVSLGALKEGLSSKADFRPTEVHWNPEDEYCCKTLQKQFKTHFYYCKCGRHHSERTAGSHSKQTEFLHHDAVRKRMIIKRLVNIGCGLVI